MRKAFIILISPGCKLWCCVTVILMCHCNLFYYLWAKEIRCNAISHFLPFLVFISYFIYLFIFEHCVLFVNLVERLDFCSALSDIEVSHKWQKLLIVSITGCASLKSKAQNLTNPLAHMPIYRACSAHAHTRNKETELLYLIMSL